MPLPKRNYVPVKCLDARCDGHLTVARLQWTYTNLLIDPSVESRHEDKTTPSAFPGNRHDSRIVEAELDDLGDMESRRIQCDTCGADYDEDDEALVTALEALKPA